MNEKDPLEEEDIVSLEDLIKYAKIYWQYIWRFKWIVVAVGIVGGIIGVAYAALKTVRYTAHYSFSVNSGSSSGSSGIGSLASLMGISVGGSGELFSGDNVLEIIRSRELVDRTLLSATEYQGDSITFMEYALIVDSVRAKCEEEAAQKVENENGEETKISVCDVHYPYGQLRETLTREQDSILMQKATELLKTCVVASRRDKKLAFMDYDFTYTDEAFAKAFAKAHLEACTKFYVDMRTQSLIDNIDRFQTRADSTRKELDRALVRRAVYLDENRNASGLYISSQSQKIETDIQVLSATYAEIVKNVEVLKLDLVKEKPLITIVDKPRLPLTNDKKSKLKMLISGGFIGGFLACLGIIGYAFIKEKMDSANIKAMQEEEA